jgi:GNAT superfamily N-acetyltransferase
LPAQSDTKTSSGVIVRRATRGDVRAVVDLVIGLAKFERLEPPDLNARSRLVRDIFDRKRANVLVAGVGRKLVGYALYFYTYSSFLARPTLYLEDIFVRDDSRRSGVGKALFMRCVKEANLHVCGRIEWAVLTWNRKAMNFYEGLGAKRLDDQYIYRLDGESLRRSDRSHKVRRDSTSA